MAPKKRLPSPSLEDDHPPSNQKQPEDEVDSSDEEDSSSEEEDFQIQPVSKNPPPSTPISNPKPASESESESGSDSGSDSGSGSDSETDSEPEPTPPPNSKVKPLASKPMKAQPKPQIQAQSTPVPAKSGTKRPVENGNDSNRSKKKTTAASVAGAASDDESETEEDVKLAGEDSKKNTQRIFGEEDEITILKGLADFISKTGKDPLKDGPAFHSFVKKSLRAEANSEQLKRKVRSLKKKFEASDNFTKPHDKKAFELFKKVWGNNGANEAEENGKVNKGVKKEATGSVKKETVKAESEVDTSLSWSEMCRFTDSLGLSTFNRDAMKVGYELLAESKKVELAERWRKVQIAEMELLVGRTQLIKDQSNLILQALDKSNK